MASGLRWTTRPADALPRAADAYMAAVRRGVHGVLMANAPRIEAEMKSGAPWTDRTGNARQGLYTAVQPMSGIDDALAIELILAHGVDYGAFLEGYDPERNYAPLARGTIYAIVQPTIDQEGPRLWAQVRRMIRGQR